MDIYEEIARLRKAGRRAALATIVQVQGSIPSYETSKILVRDDGTILGTVGGGCVEAEVWSVAQDVMREEKSRRLHFNLNQMPEEEQGLVCGGSLDIFVEPILAVPTLFLLGGGHVSLAVSRIAGISGFETVVADDRESFASRDRFPEAAALFSGLWDEILPRLAVNEFSYIVVATRGHKSDLECLRWAIAAPARFVGMVGSRRKRVEFTKILSREGAPEERLARIHSPVGLGIGALTPGEIAVSIVAEMIAARRNADVSAASLSPSHKASQTRPARQTS